MIHILKCRDEFMTDLACGKKSFEVRKNDRNFKVRDTIILKGWNTSASKYTDIFIEAKVKYILKGGAWGIKEGYVIMGINVVTCNF